MPPSDLRLLKLAIPHFPFKRRTSSASSPALPWRGIGTARSSIPAALTTPSARSGWGADTEGARGRPLTLSKTEVCLCRVDLLRTVR